MQFTGIGKLIKDLTGKTTLEDTDCFIVGTDDAKKITWSDVFSAVSDGIKAKILEWTFANLTTTNKTIPEAINELNMNLTPTGLPLTKGAKFKNVAMGALRLGKLIIITIEG